ncbi:hypothetical protein [Mesorhizobium sp. KR9-304]|uniref:hypothetical protein n=1 Tax=Mesorhizobium sp. KR9-304 TaxID=3156614 RepID=UPI0032B3F141
MARSRLFGYAIDEEDGKLVIMIDGVLAESAIKQIRDSAETGRGGEILSKLLPIGSIYKLMSSEEEEDEALSLEQLLGQNVDQSFSSFEQQFAELKETLDGLNPSKSSK